MVGKERLIVFSKWYVWATHLAMLALGVYIGAHLSGPTIDSQMEAGSQLTGPSLSPVGQPQDKRFFHQYTALKESTLYGGSGRAAVPAPGLALPPPPTPIPPEGPLQLRLIGTIVGSAEQTYAFIEDLSAQRRALYRIGDIVQRAKILEISRNRVVLDKGGRREELLNLQDFETASPTAEATPEPTLHPPPTMVDVSEQADEEEATATHIRKVGDNEWSISRDELSKQFENLHHLLREARLIPHFRDDQAAGFIVTRLSTKSFLEQIGLRNGDILTGMNGQKLHTLEEALQAYQSLQGESVLQLEIERNQRKEIFTYEIR
jgi:general secretion pathway protein C